MHGSCCLFGHLSCGGRYVACDARAHSRTKPTDMIRRNNGFACRGVGGVVVPVLCGMLSWSARGLRSRVDARHGTGATPSRLAVGRIDKYGNGTGGERFLGTGYPEEGVLATKTCTARAARQ